MTLKDQILAVVLREPGVSDAGIAKAIPGAVSRPQQVNRRCHVLQSEGLIERRKSPGAPTENWPLAAARAELRDRTAAQVRGGPSKDAIVGHTEVTAPFSWLSAGAVTRDSFREPAVPRLSAVAGIYRLRFMGQRSVHVGEATDRRRRMQNHRTPGRTQQTSTWVNARGRECLEENGTVMLDVSVDARSRRGTAHSAIDLSSKTARMFVENAARLSEAQDGWTLLNKANG